VKKSLQNQKSLTPRRKVARVSKQTKGFLFANPGVRLCIFSHLLRSQPVTVLHCGWLREPKTREFPERIQKAEVTADVPEEFHGW